MGEMFRGTCHPSDRAREDEETQVSPGITVRGLAGGHQPARRRLGPGTGHGVQCPLGGHSGVSSWAVSQASRQTRYRDRGRGRNNTGFWLIQSVQNNGCGSSCASQRGEGNKQRQTQPTSGIKPHLSPRPPHPRPVPHFPTRGSSFCPGLTAGALSAQPVPADRRRGPDQDSQHPRLGPARWAF